MNELNIKFSEVSVEDLQHIDGGRARTTGKGFGKAFGFYEVLKEVYDCGSDFVNGFMKGMTNPD